MFKSRVSFLNLIVFKCLYKFDHTKMTENIISITKTVLFPLWRCSGDLVERVMHACSEFRSCKLDEILAKNFARWIFRYGGDKRNFSNPLVGSHL